ncbi:hypothetical protein CCMA1212_010180 [Trichoderma ghanense]|uniref:Uncharacterized protein n=1 Tax=Trichoderma ghanense TaxID=65468 RepID=A0ABY2GQX6_9HYPO
MTEGQTKPRVEDAIRISDLVSIVESNLEIARHLDIIPLRDGSLTSLAAGPVYWPTSTDADIPADIAIRVVDGAALKHDGHRQTLKMLGVQQASVQEIRSLILQKHATPGDLTLTACKEHLHFLYLTHEYRHSDDELHDIHIIDQKLRLKRPREEAVYVPGRTPFSPEQLLSHMEAADSRDLPCSTSFMNAALLEDPPSVPTAAHFGVATYPTWKRWLSDCLGILGQIRLANQTGDDLSDEFAQISQRKPDIVLGLLAQIWKSQHKAVSETPELMSKIRNILVPCRTKDLRPLWETYMPFKHLQRRCLEFMKPDEPFPFLDFGTPPPSTEDLSRKWAFLYRDLGVSKNDDLGFLLDILSYIQEANPGGLSSQRCHELARLYCEIEATCVASEEPESERDICR